MEIFLFVVSLILYGEFGEELETRYTARMVLYGYTLSLLSMSYITSPLSLLVALSCILYSLGNILITTSIVRIKPFIVVTMILHVVNYISIYSGDYSLILSAPCYANNSDVILRDLSIVTVGLCSTTILKDTWLNIAIFILFMISHLYRFM